jgi:hypothetical protein
VRQGVALAAGAAFFSVAASSESLGAILNRADR